MKNGSPLKHDVFLHERAREAIRTGVLPVRAPDRVWGGLGTGARCCLCGLAIGPDQTELELEFVPEDRSTKSAYHIVHLRCFSAFETEREQHAPDAPAGTSPAGMQAPSPAT